MKGFPIETKEDLVKCLKYIQRLMINGVTFKVITYPYEAEYGASAKYLIDTIGVDYGFNADEYLRED